MRFTVQLNIIHGTKDAVNFVCDHPDIRAVSFVGSNPVGQLVHKRATASGKRCQANLGAKNHGIVLPDADKAHFLSSLAGAAFGAAGQRCMALSTLVMVGETREWLDELVEMSRDLYVPAACTTCRLSLCRLRFTIVSPSRNLQPLIIPIAHLAYVYLWFALLMIANPRTRRKPNFGMEPDADLGPLVTVQVCSLCVRAVPG